MTRHLALRDCDRPFAGRPAPPSVRGVRGAGQLPVAVVVVTGFSMLELGAIVEPLAFVTREHPGTLSKVELVGCTSEAPVSASGLPLAAGDTVAGLAARIARGARFAAVFVCCGGSVVDAERAPLAGLMRTCHRQKIRLCVSGGATTVLAECGLLRDHRAVAHWKSLGAQREIHPQVLFDDVLFVSAGTLTSCAGESAAFDMTMDFLAASLPTDAVAGVRTHFMVGWTRGGADRQPGSVRALADSLPPPLAAVLKVMNDSIEVPLSLRQLCAVAGLSQRQVERLFRRHLSASPNGFYASLRLDRARQLILQTRMPLCEVAIATGFARSVSLSRRYLARFGATPNDDRRRVSVPGATTGARGVGHSCLPNRRR